MKYYYKGVVPGVDELSAGYYCLGFVETKSTRGGRNQLHIEKISGCRALGKEETAEDYMALDSLMYGLQRRKHRYLRII